MQKLFNHSEGGSFESFFKISAATNFTISKDYVSFEDIYGENSTANRTSNHLDPLLVRVRDQNQSYVSSLNITFKITRDGTSYDTGTINSTNETGTAILQFNPGCSPRYDVGPQKWQAIVSGETCYQNNQTAEQNLTIMGDISLTINTPDGTRNYTQEESITFLGYTVDDCGTALTTNVTYYANTTALSYNCNTTDPVVPIGANAYSCAWTTNLSTQRGYYNASMTAETNYYYNNYTYRTKDPALFYLHPLKKLETPLVIPTLAGWGYKNWNFSITASSGDPDEVYNVTLLMGQSWPPATPCIGCANRTTTLNSNNIRQNVYWLRNFTYTQKGSWYYRYQIGATQTQDVLNVLVTEDTTNMTAVTAYFIPLGS